MELTLACLSVVAALSGNPLYDDICAPKAVATPPTFAVNSLCRTADDEIRHYGWQMVGGEKRRVYIASQDNGLSWKTLLASDGEAGYMERSPESGEWVGFCGNAVLHSKIGPGDPNPERTVLQWKDIIVRRIFVRQLLHLKSKKRWVAAISDCSREQDECYHAAVALSDDDGRTWRWVSVAPVKNVPRLHPGDRRPHWYNDGCEPSIAELKDGTLMMALRTSGEHHAFCVSNDGGETWSEGKEHPAFWAANTMPYLFRLSDGRLLFFWNNTAMLPTRDASEYPEIDDATRAGRWETVFTNRDALHAAISDDDGKTWKGFREIALTEPRNSCDFRELGNDPAQEHDKSVHQTQALELPGGKVMLAYGQNSAARRIVIFDPDWLLETTREEDFRTGLCNISNHLYVRSLSGGWQGWAGHCAWNRMPGATLVRDPDTDNPPPGGNRSVREVLQLSRIHDPRLVSERQGVVWNFPAARKGKVTIDCRIVGAGFRLTLADHWMNPCDEIGPERSPFSMPITARELPGTNVWHELCASWDEDDDVVALSVDGKRVAVHPLSSLPPFGLSYLHLQTLAETADEQGTYFRSFRKE